jgi:AraC-like DNA-binding protein
MINTVVVQVVQHILSLAAQCEFNPEELMAAINLDAQYLENLDGRISCETFYALWHEIMQRSGDPSIGLRMATVDCQNTSAVVVQSAYCSPTIGEALKRLVQYSQVANTGRTINLEIKAEVARISFASAVGFRIAMPITYCQWCLANLVLQGRQITGVDWVPLEVGFQCAPPDDLTQYHHLFRSPLAFYQPVNYLLIEAEFLQHPLRTANPALSVILDRYAAALLAKLPKPESFIDSVTQMIAEELHKGEPGLEAIANRLGYAPRTLQRRLKEVGTSYQELLAKTRSQFAIQYLQEEHIAISEIACLLGFSEASAFHRAFKRWTGRSPGEFRACAYVASVSAKTGVAESTTLARWRSIPNVDKHFS